MDRIDVMLDEVDEYGQIQVLITKGNAHIDTWVRTINQIAELISQYDVDNVTYHSHVTDPS